MADKETDVLILLYQDAMENIRDMKRQQWAMAYYGIALYAVLVAYIHLYSVTFSSHPRHSILMVAAAFVIPLFAGWSMGRSQSSKEDSRCRMRGIIGKFDNENTSKRFAKLAYAKYLGGKKCSCDDDSTESVPPDK